VLEVTPTTAKRVATARSNLEAQLAMQIKAEGLPEPFREFRFHKTRRWRFDFAWPYHMGDRNVAVEVQGGIWSGGRHARGAGIKADCEKANAAQLLGWMVLKVCGDHIKSGEAIAWIKEALA
jgi:hypothetical protein